eukprot:g331.t1
MQSSSTLSAAHSLFDAERFEEAADVLNGIMEDIQSKNQSTDGPMSQTVARGRVMIGIVEGRISTKAQHEFGSSFSLLAQYNIAVKALRTNNPKMALEHLDQILQHYPLFAPALYNHGAASYQIGDMDTALTMFSACNRSSVDSDGKMSDLAAAAIRNLDLILSGEDALAFAQEHSISKFISRSGATEHLMLESAVRHSLHPKFRKDSHQELILVELGVWRGDTIRRIAVEAAGHEVYGFDSFFGLPSDFAGGQFQRGAFSTRGSLPPRLPINVEIRAGWFNETIAPFVKKLRAENSRVAFVHVDCDLYSSAKEALSILAPVLSERAVIQFDQFFGYPQWRDGEARAWWDVSNSFAFNFSYIWYEGMKVTVQLN